MKIYQITSPKVYEIDWHREVGVVPVDKETASGSTGDPISEPVKSDAASSTARHRCDLA